MAARQNVPVIGMQRNPYLGKGQWQFYAGYRWQRSDRHFTGKHEEKQRETEHSEVINNIHLIDFAGTYAISQRLNVSLSLPIFLAERSNPIRSAGIIVDRAETQARGIGDMSLTGRAWLFGTEKNPGQNVALGLGLKFPTGKYNVQDTFKTLTGSVVRSVDQSIQPGDGGWGVVLDVQAFKLLFGQVTLFGSGTYLINPQNTNGTLTGRGRPSEAVMSVADQYLARVGFAFPILPKHGLAASLAGRWEGVPVTDWFGASDGFRRPGYAVSLDPGLIYTRGAHTFSVNVPIALSRNRQRSVPDLRDGRHGDAAFADYLILLGYTRRF